MNKSLTSLALALGLMAAVATVDAGQMAGNSQGSMTMAAAAADTHATTATTDKTDKSATHTKATKKKAKKAKKKAAAKTAGSKTDPMAPK
ncbi:MAG: hypothetical protein HQL91_03380 [Magnetococcales bacterium]|nr:hypothetical protein [Magnetococcales bacterium]